MTLDLRFVLNNYRVPRLAWTAMDQSYGRVSVGDAMGPIDNTGLGRTQPFETPSGFYVAKVVEDPTTNFKTVFYKNESTNEVIVSFMGTNGFSDTKGWNVNVTSYAREQWTAASDPNEPEVRNGDRVYQALAPMVSADTKVIVVGDSKGTMLAQYFTDELVRRRYGKYYDQAQFTGELGSLKTISNENLMLVARAGAGIEAEMRRNDPTWQEESSAMNGIAFFYAAPTGELVSKLGGALLGSEGRMYYYDGGGSIDPMYLHRLASSGWDFFSSGRGFGDMSEAPREQMDVNALQRIGAAFAGLFRNGEGFTSPEAALNLGTSLVSAMAFAPPGQVFEAVRGGTAEMFGDVGSRVAGGAAEVLSWMGRAYTFSAGGFAKILQTIGVMGTSGKVLGLTGDRYAGSTGQDVTLDVATLMTGASAVEEGTTRTLLGRGSDNVLRVMDASEGQVVVYAFNGTQRYQEIYATDGSGNYELRNGSMSYFVKGGDQQSLSINGTSVPIPAGASVIPFGANGFQILDGDSRQTIQLNGRYSLELRGGNGQWTEFERGNLINPEDSNPTPNWDNGLLPVVSSVFGVSREASLYEPGVRDWELVNGRPLQYQEYVMKNASGKPVEILRIREDGTSTLTNIGSADLQVGTAITYNPVSRTLIVMQDKAQGSGKLAIFQTDDAGTPISGSAMVSVPVGAEAVNYRVEFGVNGNGDSFVKSVTTASGGSLSNETEIVQSLNDIGFQPRNVALLTQDEATSQVTNQAKGVLTQAVSSYDTFMRTGTSIIDALSMIRAIQSGQPLPVVASGLRLAASLDRLDGTVDSINLSGAASIAGGVLSVLSLERALENGDALAAITAGAQTITFGAQAYAALVEDNVSKNAIAQVFGADSAISQISSALPYLSIVNSLAHGDTMGAAIAAISISFPPIGIAYSVFSIVSSIFGGHRDPPPELWGGASATWSGFDAVANAYGAHGGQDTARSYMSQFIAQLDSLAAREQQLNPNSPIGVVANRLPSFSYRNYSGFTLNDTDPLTGVQENVGVRYDLTGHPYGAPAGSEVGSQSFAERFIRIALERGAIAPLWEEHTAAIQTQYGDPQAGLTEEERAGRNGLLATQVTGNSQFWRPVALDLNGNGIETTGGLRSVAFDVDDSGYLKNTAWLAGGDGFLFLDRNLNGSLDASRELFSNGMLDISARGLAGMRWVDSNYDGSLTAADPVWNELKVWVDANGDGQAQAGEAQGLSALGITSLNYAMGTFQQNGVLKQLGSPDLAADTQGMRTHVVPEGIVIETSQGEISLLATHIDDRSLLEANRDGVTSYEDIETIISTADLLANDTLAGFLGQNLTVTGVSGFTHGTGYLDVNGFVHFRPEANYYGPASFSYSIQAPTGQTATATVDVTLQNVNDAPTATVDLSNSVVVVHDIDDASGAMSYSVVQQPQQGSGQVDGSGHFSYTNWYGPNTPGVSGYDEYGNISTNSDPFIVRVTDPHGAYTDVTVNAVHQGDYNPSLGSGGGGGGKPVSLDLDNNGFQFTKVDDSQVFFDINGDGWRERMAWPSAGDGLLAFDANGDGKIDQANEISFASYVKGAQTDLEGLKAFDSNGDGMLTAADEKWAKFGVWQDANQNGVTDPGEFRTLGDLGVAAVNLTSDGQFSMIDGQTVHGIGSVTMTDGSTRDLADVTLQYSNEVIFTNPDGTTRVLTRSTFSPSGENINGTEGNDLILGKNGNNIINAYGGDDVVFEDGGNDLIDAGDGNDIVYSGADNDVVIAGAGNDVVFGGNGDDLLLGGDGEDALFGEAGNDIIFGGDGNDLVSGDIGNDVLSGDWGDDMVFGGSGNDALFGMEGNDQLGGGSGYDYLNGGDGNDILDGGSEADTMLGGTGDDTYAVDNLDDVVVESLNEGNDTVRASISYALGDNVENLTLTGVDNLVGLGNALDNVLTGNSGNNLLAGGAGNDTLNGGLGADVLMGGTGDDTYVVDNAGDQVTENAGEGVDTVRAGIAYTLGDNLENLTLTGAADLAGTGNAADNVLLGNSGNNRLDGASGADRMAGGLGDDTYVVDNAGDVVIEGLNAGDDTIESSVSYVLPDNVERLVLTGGDNIDGTGNGLDNVLIGNDAVNQLAGLGGNDQLFGHGGDDTLIGGDGNDVLDGGTGSDAMLGGSGDDSYYVDNVGDQVIEAASAGTDQVFSTISYVLPENVENLTLLGADNIDGTGNSLDNVLIGNSGNNRLDGAAGADQMAGGLGDDTYVVDNASDTVTEGLGAGYDTIESSVSYALPENVERLILTGADNINGTGNGLDNVLIGNSGNNRLDGAAGADQMAAGLGDDTYVVDNAGDVVTEGFDAGYDTIESSVSYALPDNVERLILTGNDNIDGTGNGLDNILLGNSGNNYLDGGVGVDQMAGGLGDDTYVVDHAGDTVAEELNAGYDTIESSVSYVLPDNVERLILTGTDNIDGTGNALDNVLIGNSGNNRLNGGAGADQMAGDLGDDTYVVDNAGDTVVEGLDAGYDTIESSVSYVLPDNVERLILTGSENIDGTGNALDNVLIGNSGNNRLIGLDGNDTLTGNGGNDALDGGSGNDTYVWANGDALDTITDLSGNDTVQFGDGLTVDNLALRMTASNGVYTAHIRALDANGCEMDGQGLDFLVTRDVNGEFSSPLEQFRLADGTLLNFNDLLIKTVVTGDPKHGDWYHHGDDWRDESSRIIDPMGKFNFADASTQTLGQFLEAAREDADHHDWHDDDEHGNGWQGWSEWRDGDWHEWHSRPGTTTSNIVTGRNDDIIFASKGMDTVHAGTGNDVIFGREGADTLYGEGGNDAMFGSSGTDVLDGGYGYDILVGGKGADVLRDPGHNNLMLGGSGNDLIEAGDGNDFIAGGRDNDTITTGSGRNVVAFNRDDGKDTILASAGAQNTLSLGGDIDYDDMSMSRSGNDLVLDLKHGDAVTFKDWYSDAANRSFLTLQIVDESRERHHWHDWHGSDSFDANRTEVFDFQKLVSQFDALAATGVTRWNLMNGLLDAHLDGSNDAAMGGEFAFQYGSHGDVRELGIATAQSVMKDASFGALQQGLQPFQGLDGDGRGGRC